LDIRLTIFIPVIALLCNSAQVVGDEEGAKIVFPIGELFEPLVADAKEPQFSTGLHRVKSSGQLGEFTAGVVSYGENFGLVRWQTAAVKQWQVSIAGALFAQFNMDAESKDLINADYAIGISGTHRHGSGSYRLRVLHQSTHLGDELLLGESPPERVNYSLEAVDFLAAYKWHDIRLYGGAGYLFNVEPSILDRIALQFGGDFLSNRYRLLKGNLTGGIDLTAFEGDDWGVNTTVKFGVEYGNPGSGNRRIRLMLEYYNGKAPFGQFFDVDISSYGLTAYFLF